MGCILAKKKPLKPSQWRTEKDIDRMLDYYAENFLHDDMPVTGYDYRRDKYGYNYLNSPIR